MPVNRRKPEWRKIKPFADIATNYGFESRTSSGDQGTLVQVPINPQADYQNLVIYPNNCKPHTAIKKGAGGSNSGYIDETKIQSAQAAGWRIKWGYPPRQRKAKGQNKHIKITVNAAVKYAYVRASDTLYNLLANFGHNTPDANDILWYGCQFPKPPTMGLQNAQGQSASSLCDPSKVDDITNAGGYIIDPGCYTQVHLANMLVSSSTAAP